MNNYNYELKKAQHHIGNKDNVIFKDNMFPNNRNNFEKSFKRKITQEYQSDIEKTEKMEYSFNIFEIICVYFCKCCLSKKLSLKNYLDEKANKILYHKLDIALYVRNMLLIDILNKCILEDNMKSIINFISRPILSLNNDQENEFESFYQIYTNTEFNKFSNEIYEIKEKSTKCSMDQKVLMISNKHLKELI